MRKRTTALLALSALVSASLLTGCTYESGPKSFALTNYGATDSTPAQTESATEWLQTALEKGKTDPNAQKYWYKGHVINYIMARTTTSMFNGAVRNPDGYNVDARIARQDYQYYRIGDKNYVRVKDAWMTARETPLEFDVLKGFDDWLPFLDQAVQLNDDKVYGTVCVPFQLKITGAEWLEKSNSPLFESLKKQLGDRPDLDYILKESTIKTTFWIGKDDRLLHQYETWIILPMPEGGTMDQQIFFQMFKYNDSGIEIKDPEEVEKYLLY
ncbi:MULTISPECIES: hypothetical protein [Brevibacillus]|jgi:hypothetical protein|uniref:Lipoprotein n=1 Tax=Brevibacillus borstelensis AK1 TaxID=1300222 RepID=M8EBR0_9BACL|nr:hypothetical protein [Brevibacillus borstelensis]EMT52930.1 hypothetical protein I532_09132 [Brevibacillus borstelensis AK1]MBE5397097.1 hypothetical protein [Brevibacillus borstelensis]MCC0563434.1 hypothetical protein [Brevibacillus borstelensis]MCM3471614.1 hypothetical protein [Brevibacillus borstelensis]MCM3558705.1 hypothetical protein [Brevibacillus borstelensis]